MRSAWVALAVLCLSPAACTSDGGPPESREQTSETTAVGRRRQTAVDCPPTRKAPNPGPATALTDDTEALGSAARGLSGHAAAAGRLGDDGHALLVGAFADKAGRDVVIHAGVDDLPGPAGRSSGAVFADLDGDGDDDAVLTRNVKANRRRGEEPDSAATAPTLVLRNDGGRLVAGPSLLADQAARGVGVLDGDGDGDLDLVIAVDRYGGGGTRYLRNNGGLRFEDRTAESGLPDSVAGFAVAAADLDGDRLTDLFVAGDNEVFLGRGDGRFDAAAGAVPEIAAVGREDDVTGVSTGDLDGDGRTDLVLALHYGSADRCPQSPRLFLNRSQPGQVDFEDASDDAGLPAIAGKAPHVDIVDVDGDARPDLVVSYPDREGRPMVLRNLGGAPGPRFAGPEPGPAGSPYWVTGTVADRDGDARPDILLVAPEPDQRSVLLEGTGGAWVAVAVTGPAGPGSIVEIFEAGAMGQPSRRLWREELVIGQGYAAGRPAVLLAGIGDRDAVDVRVTPRRDPPVERESVKAGDTVAVTR